MDKICHSAGDRDEHLKQLNKLSHKISKTSTPVTTIIKKPNINAFDHQNQPPPQQNLQPPHQHQPPVYNINKNDFRDVVQKLTGSPVHERFSTPPPIPQPRPPSSRLQRIRPPPLAHVSNRPPPMISSTAPPIPPPNPTATASTSTVSHNNNSGNFIHRPAATLSPLPPFPAVHAAAESPVSAYMRYLHNSISGADPNSKSQQFSGFSPLAPLISPWWSNSTDTYQQQGVTAPPSSQQQMPGSQPQSQPPSQTQFPFPSSPFPFGCLNSPRSPYPLLSPSLFISPTSGQLNFPLSPTVPVPSPIWKSL